MKAELTQLAGSALLWKATQLGIVKSLFLVRLLVLARLLAPEDFGLLAIAATASGFFLLLTDFGILPALVQRVQLNDKYYDTAWTLNVVRGLVVTASLFFGASVIAGLFDEPRAINIIRALALATLIEHMSSIKLADLIRALGCRSLAITGIARASIDTVVAIALGQLLGVWALVAGAFAGAATYTCLSYIVAPYSPRLCLDRKAVQGLIRYGRWILLTGLIAVAGSAVLRVVISNRLGTVELGIFFLAAKLAFLPAEIAKEVIGAVSFSLYAKLQGDSRQVAQAFRATAVSMFALVIPLCCLIILLAPSLVDNMLGSKWTGTLPIIQLLAIAGLVCPVGELTVSLVQGLGRPYRATVLEAVQYSLTIALTFALIGGYGLIGVAIGWSVGIFASQSLSLCFALQMINRPFLGIASPIAAISCASLTGALVAFWIDRQIGGVAGLTVAALLGPAIAATLSWYLDRRLDFGLGRNLLKAYPPLARIIGPAPASL